MAASAITGIVCAFSFGIFLTQGKPRTLQVPHRLSMRQVFVNAKPSTAGTSAQPESLLLLPGDYSSKAKAITKRIDKTTSIIKNDSSVSSTPTPDHDIQNLPTLGQPPIGQLAVAGTLPTAGLPSIPAPPAPPEEPFAGEIFEDKPGGSILVLGLLLNDSGTVLEARILVPSRYVLGDMTAFYASKEQRFIGLVPPIQPGEVRWIQERIDQDGDSGPKPLLP